ncbi:26S proteasome non-ATPase regulatory subunit 8-like [Corticium candelabrum]|uniref:26S proteasome non-ATPase regulatory subunit 8-like n=1 Tax=Corticium candelabrum TaxID=121492 RepID=UPI002E2716A0|nr:26S proteasome non-ATPase regulatory subunit 8-like [Corticium candelabrum]
MESAVELLKKLRHEWSRKPDAEAMRRCGVLLPQLKLSLTSLGFLAAAKKQPTVQELIIARDGLEIGALWSIEKSDIPTFERYMAQLRCYYSDYKDSLPKSAYQYELTGLNLLSLLAQNRLAEFHIELEVLPPDDLSDNVYLRHPIALERYLMEGSYNKIFLSRGNVPSETYNFFIDMLVDTVREEIASCAEKSYQQLDRREATKMLFLDSEEDMDKIAESRCWELRNGFYCFDQREKMDVAIPSIQVIHQTLEYARELERIV